METATDTISKQQVIIDASLMNWQQSPSAGVWRKRLEHIGAVESGQVTSIVRYEPGSAFSPHPHPEGEEILVLEGTFSDELGDYPAGSYLLNPEGFRHAPFSKEGCTIFVKLRQYAGYDRQRVSLNTHKLPWITEAAGVAQKLLYSHTNYPERMQLERWQAGTTLQRDVHLGGEEILILQGSFVDDDRIYGAGTWLRNPSGMLYTASTQEGCVLYIKTGWSVDSLNSMN